MVVYLCNKMRFRDFLKMLVGKEDCCSDIINKKTCLERQCDSPLKYTCSYCYAVGNEIIIEGEYF